jgi:hypothetical protein
MSLESFRCSICGEVHSELITDWGCRLPDDVYALSYLDRYKRSRYNDDFCTLASSGRFGVRKRYFLRGVLPVPFTEAEGYFGWGVWAEVGRRVHDLYVSNFHEDLVNDRVYMGVLANNLSVFPPIIGLAVEIRFQGPRDRPFFHLDETNSHVLTLEQRRGIDGKRHHDLLAELGAFQAADE